MHGHGDWGLGRPWAQLSPSRTLLCLVPTSVMLCHPGGSDGEESACNSGDLGSILGWEDPLEKGTATHSSILAWRIPWTEEPGRLQPIGSQRVGHD